MTTDAVAASGRLLLVGLMGTGKTTVGRMVAATLGWRYLDNDEAVRDLEGSNLDELLRERGYDVFRRAEAAALRAALVAPVPVAAAAAAWVVEVPELRQDIRASDAVVVWLRAEPLTLVHRIGSDVSRPWLQPDPLSALTAMAKTRNPLYEEVSDLIIDVDQLDAATVASRLTRS